jgi:4-hydroxy-4-methyl-2-oxoglutarate aldolase
VSLSCGISPITTRSLAVDGEINTTVRCGGVSVAPGDIILAADNGIMVLYPDQVAELVEHYMPIAQRELETQRRLRAGESLADMTNAHKTIADALAAQGTH